MPRLDRLPPMNRNNLLTFPAQVNDQQVLGLADARQISSRVVFTSPAVQHLLPMLDGTRELDQIVVEVGRGHRPPAWILDVLASRDRTRAGPTAPPQGLFLMAVAYDE